MFELLADYWFCIEELGYTKEEAMEALNLDFDPIVHVGFASPMTEQEEREEAEYLTALSRSGR